MNLNELPKEGTALHALQSGRLLSLDLPAGATVRALTGAVWLTAEGSIEDVVLAAGRSFATRGSGRVVMNAVDGSATVVVELPAETLERRFELSPRMVAAIEAKARRLRQDELARVAHLVVNKVASFAKAQWSSLSHRRSVSRV